QADAEMREGMEVDALKMFTALDSRLGSAESITVYPGKLMEASDWLSPERVGKLLRTYGFEPGQRTKEGGPYTITRAKFLEQSQRYGYSPAGVGESSAGVGV